jgi:hypothetical protein
MELLRAFAGMAGNILNEPVRIHVHQLACLFGRRGWEAHLVLPTRNAQTRNQNSHFLPAHRQE